MEKTQNSPLTCLPCARPALDPGRPSVGCLNNLMFAPFFSDPTAILTPRPSACSRACALSSLVSTQRFRLAICRHSSPRTHHLYRRLWLSQLTLDKDSHWPGGVTSPTRPARSSWPVLEMGGTRCMLSRGVDGRRGPAACTFIAGYLCFI